MQNYNAKLCGYGLAKVGVEGYRSRVPVADTYLDDRICFTPVYMYGAPEYMMHGTYLLLSSNSPVLQYP